MLRDDKTGAVILDVPDTFAFLFRFCLVHHTRGVVTRFRIPAQATRELAWRTRNGQFVDYYIAECARGVHVYEDGGTAVLPRPPIPLEET